MPSIPDHYQALQVHPSAEPEVVQAAYRRLCLKYHPDVYNGADAHQRMTLLNQAYAVLSDPEKRRAYDRQLAGVGAAGTASAKTHPSSAVQPQLLMTPTRLNFGPVPVGRTRSASLRISNVGRGRLDGLVTCKVPWMTVTPAEFSGNEVTLTVRFQPGMAGQFSSDHAVEVYSNGGRATVQVRGIGSGDAGQETSTRPAHQPLAGSGIGVAQRTPRLVAKTQQSKLRMPFMAWVTVGAAVSSFFWFQVSPILAVVPLGFACWLTWQRLFVRRRQGEVAVPPRGRGGEQPGRASVQGGCPQCGATRPIGLQPRCAECGGSICSVCRACPCGAHMRRAGG